MATVHLVNDPRQAALYLVASPSVLAPGMDPRKLEDEFSSSYLTTLASRMAQEVGEAHRTYRLVVGAHPIRRTRRKQ